MPFAITDIQPTPNPNAVKFLLDRPISEGPVSFLRADQAARHPVGEPLFAIPGVTSVFLLGDFVTVNKESQKPWPAIKKRVREVLAEI